MNADADAGPTRARQPPQPSSDSADDESGHRMSAPANGDEYDDVLAILPPLAGL